jgi:hypothetical protein
MSLQQLECALRTEIGASWLSLRERMTRANPLLTVGLCEWLHVRLQGRSLAEYLVHADAHPVAYLTRFAARADRVAPVLLEAITRSNVAASVAIRLLDDVMDERGERASRARHLLPVLSPLLFETMAPYRTYFGERPALLAALEQHWLCAADFTYADAQLADCDEQTFRTLCARKLDAAKLPIAALCAAAPDEPYAAWQVFLDAFAVWHQMWNDTLDWRADWQNGLTTYFLCEATRAAGTDHVALMRWALGPGLCWACERIEQYWTELRTAAVPLASPLLTTFLQRREPRFRAQLAAMHRQAEHLHALERSLAAGMRSAAHGQSERG